jgi:hypothetical protein
VDKAGEPGKLRIIRDLSFKGKAPFSVNDKIDKNAFTTKWGTAAMVIDLVCVYYLFPYLFYGHDGTFRRRHFLHRHEVGQILLRPYVM